MEITLSAEGSLLKSKLQCEVLVIFAGPDAVRSDYIPDHENLSDLL